MSEGDIAAGGIQLDKFLINEGPDKIFYIPEFITKAEEDYLKGCVYKAPIPRWTQLQNRRLQNWGGVPHPKGMIAEEIPSWLKDGIMKKVTGLGVFGEKTPNHVLVNEYLSGQGIMPHLDGPLFYPTITTVNLGSHGILNFYRPIQEIGGESESSSEMDWESRLEFSLLLQPRSLLVLQETCYHHFLHGIDEKTSDVITDKMLNADRCEGLQINDVLTRDTRVSLTIRHVPKTTKTMLRIGR